MAGVPDLADRRVPQLRCHQEDDDFKVEDIPMTTFASFEELATARVNAADAREGTTQSYDGAFVEPSDMAKLSVIDGPTATEMPDPDMARRAVEMAIGTVFDVLKDTRMEEFARQLAWGMVNSFHMTARIAEGREDEAAKKLGEMARNYDPSEIYANELDARPCGGRLPRRNRQAFHGHKGVASQ
jgi:hypothetical protein